MRQTPCKRMLITLQNAAFYATFRGKTETRPRFYTKQTSTGRYGL